MNLYSKLLNSSNHLSIKFKIFLIIQFFLINGDNEFIF
jgi:hypothetical protein